MILFSPDRLSAWIENLLNEDVQKDISQNERLFFKVDTLFGKFDSNLLLDINSKKTNYIYAIITDPSGTIIPIKDLGMTNQQIVLHMYFKIDFKNKIYNILNNLINLLAGGSFEIPGDENDTIVTNCAFPIVGDADAHSVKEVDKRNGLLYKEANYYIDATMTIYFSTGKVALSNSLKLYLNDERIYITDTSFAIAKQVDPEQYSGSSNIVSTASATEKNISIPTFYLDSESDLFTSLLEDSLQTNDDYDQNKIYTFKIVNGDSEIIREVIIKNLTVAYKIGAPVSFSAQFCDADKEVLNDG